MKLSKIEFIKIDILFLYSILSHRMLTFKRTLSNKKATKFFSKSLRSESHCR